MVSGLRSEKISFLRLPFQGLTPEVDARLRATLRDTLQRGGFSVIDEREVEDRLQRDPSLATCTTRSCYARLALMLGVRRVIEGTLQHPQRSSYSMRLQVRDLKSGQPVGAPVDERCDICSTEEAQQMVARGAERLAHSTPPAAEGNDTSEAGVLQIESQPLGAVVTLDGARQDDRTPAYFMLSVGVHSLELSAPGHEPLRRPVEVGPGQPSTLNLEMVPLRPRRPWLTALSYTALTAGVGLGVASGLYFAYDGKPVTSSSCQGPPQGGAFACPEKYDTRIAGIATAAGAGVLLIAAGIMFYVDHAPPKRRVVVTRDK